MARTKYVPPSGVSSLPEYISHVQGLMAKAHTDPAAFMEANALMGEKALNGFNRWLAARPQEWVETRTLDEIYKSASVSEAFKKVSSGDKGSTGVGVFATPDPKVFLRVIAVSAENLDNGEGDE